jgi:hypothetical protein
MNTYMRFFSHEKYSVGDPQPTAQPRGKAIRDDITPTQRPFIPDSTDVTDAIRKDQIQTLPSVLLCYAYI